MGQDRPEQNTKLMSSPTKTATEETIDRNLMSSIGTTTSINEDDELETIYRGETSTPPGNVDTDDCIVFNNNKLSANKYLVNKDFHHNIKHTDTETREMRTEMEDVEHSWLPSILHGEEWPEQPQEQQQQQQEEGDLPQDDLISAVSISHEPDLDNPLLTTSKDTVMWNNDTKARDAAAWKKYKEEADLIINNKNNLRDLPTDQSTVPNTFANKRNDVNNQNKHRKQYRNLSDLPNESPLKIFHVYENEGFKETPSKLSSDYVDDDKLPNVMKESDDLYNRILTGKSSNGSLIHNQRGNQLSSGGSKVQETSENKDDSNEIDEDAEEFTNDDNTNNTNRTNTQDDYTSDAEEFSSFPSTTRKMVYAGDKLFQHIREGFQNGRLPLAMTSLNIQNNDQSDYTSADDEEMGKVKESIETSNAAINFDNSQSVHESTSDSILPMNEAQSLEKARELLSSQAEQYNKEFNVPAPVLQQQFRASINNSTLEQQEDHPKIKGLNFISAESYKNKVYDKKLKKYVSLSQIIEQPNDSSYTNDDFFQTTHIGSQDSSNDTLNAFDNLSIGSDIDMTSNSILRTKKGLDGLKNEVSFMQDNTNENSENTLEGKPIDDNSEERKNHLGGDTDADTETELEMNESFSMTDKFLVEVISESYPSEDWEHIKELDISGCDLEQLYHLDKMTPNIWYLNASDNSISQNFGVPSEVQYLDLSLNKFSSISAKFGGMKFKYLQHLNLSNNSLTDLRCLKELRNLTSLDLSHNFISNIDYLENFRMLQFLNLSNNRIGGSLDFRNLTMWFLEDLLLDNNKIEKLINICELPRLVNISANNNILHEFTHHVISEEDTEIPPHTNLRRISLNYNNFQDIIDFSAYINLKEVHLDDTNCEGIEGLAMEIEKVSTRYNNVDETMNGEMLKFSLHAHGLRRLYLSGGKLPTVFPLYKDKNRFSNVSILDISAMDLESIPQNFSNFFPLLVDLNLNFNRLQNLKGLEGLQHLRQLKLLSNQIREIEDVVNYTSNVRMCLKLIDLRGNPLTKRFYPFIFYDEEEMSEVDSTVVNDVTNLNLHDKEDIEAFSIEYSRLYEPNAMQDWALKNRRHQRKLTRDLRSEKQQYFADIVTWLEHVKVVDGAVVNSHDRQAFRR